MQNICIAFHLIQNTNIIKLQMLKNHAIIAYILPMLSWLRGRALAW